MVCPTSTSANCFRKNAVCVSAHSQEPSRTDANILRRPVDCRSVRPSATAMGHDVCGPVIRLLSRHQRIAPPPGPTSVCDLSGWQCLPVHTVINRGNRRRAVFKTDGDDRSLLTCLEQSSTKVDLEGLPTYSCPVIFSWCRIRPVTRSGLLFENALIVALQ